jgi:hypothetical protein
MKYRLFALDGCDNCEAMMRGFRESRVTYFYVDAEDDASQSLCDRHGVDEVPHVQILNNKNKVVYEHIGFIDPQKIIKIAAKFEKQ